MSEIKEIEIKIFIGKSNENVVKVINKLSWELINDGFQEDIYYTSKYKDFIETEECLRIRTTNSYCQMTWKPPTTNEMFQSNQFWKQEVDLELNNQKEIAKALLKNLDFIEYVIVYKDRKVYKVDEHSVIALDKINPLGWFLEIETISKDEKNAKERNEELLEILGINNPIIINVPYRDLVKAGKVYKREN